MSVYAIFNPCPTLTFSDAGDHCDDIAIFCDDFCDDYGDAATVADKKFANGADIAPPDAEKLLGLYHEIAAGVPDAVFMLCWITPAKTKGASETIFSQRWRVGDVEGMATEARARGAHNNVYFGPALMRRGLAKGQRGKEAELRPCSPLLLRKTPTQAKK